MNTRSSFVFVALSIVLTVSRGSAQQAAPQLTYEMLRAAHASDSLRVVVSHRRAALDKPRRLDAASSDTIARQRREIAALRAALAQRDSIPLTSTRPHADLLQSVRPAPVVPAPALTDSGAVRSTTPASVSASAKAPSAPAATPIAATTARVAPPSPPVITGMLQLWLVGGDAGYRNTYRVRRAEVRASGAVAPRVSWTLMLDLGKALSATSVTTASGATQTSVAQSGRALQDAAVMMQLHPRARLDVGQQKIPFGIEGFQSSGTLVTVERTLFASDRARGGSFGDMRDVGASLRGRLGSALDYNVGVFNGSGESQNDVDANEAKALVAHLAFRPLAKLLVGVSGVTGGRGAADAPLRDRLGLEMKLQTSRVLVQAEAVAGRDGALTRQGMYAHAGFRVRPPLDLHVRFDAWDPDRAREADAASATERDYLAGLTWNVVGTTLKAQTDVVHRTYSASLVPTRTQLLLNLQTNW